MSHHVHIALRIHAHLRQTRRNVLHEVVVIDHEGVGMIRAVVDQQCHQGEFIECSTTP